MPRHYTADDHKAAFEAYLEVPTFNHVGRVLGIDSQKASWWASPTFRCKFGCPYHNYPILLREREVAVSENIKLFEEKKGSVSESKAIIKKIVEENHADPDNAATVIATLNKIVRSDLERLTHWEYLYGMVFYQLTGIELDYDHIVDRNGKFKVDAEAYLKASRIDKAEKCVYLLSHIQDQIENIKGRIAPDNPNAGHQQPQDQKLKIEDLRALMMTLNNGPDVNVIINGMGPSREEVIDITGRKLQ
jgi:hypothetical protein